MEGSIVVVDDIPSLLALAGRFLDGLGYEVECFQDPLLALKRVQDRTKKKVLFLITDFDLEAEVTGKDIAEKARENGIPLVWLHSSNTGKIPDQELLRAKRISVRMKKLNFGFRTEVANSLKSLPG